MDYTSCPVPGSFTARRIAQILIAQKSNLISLIPHKDVSANHEQRIKRKSSRKLLHQRTLATILQINAIRLEQPLGRDDHDLGYRPVRQLSHHISAKASPAIAFCSLLVSEYSRAHSHHRPSLIRRTLELYMRKIPLRLPHLAHAPGQISAHTSDKALAYMVAPPLQAARRTRPALR
jgi:hypothetical protein